MSYPVISGDMIQNYYMSRFEQLKEIRKQKLAAIITAEQAQNYITEVRTALKKGFGNMPERGPLNFRITRTEVHDGIAVKAVLFDSMPGLAVSAIYFHPENQTNCPGVLALCGHAAEGCKCDTYTTFAFNLAKLGFAVLMPDPISQGERHQFLNHPDSLFHFNGLCGEHNQLGKMLALFGDNFAMWRLFEASCATDCLCAMPEVDPTRLGVTGNSGGGTMTSYVWSMDDRFSFAVPACYITSFYRNFDNELPVDAEQNIPGFAAGGFEMADFLIARAPLPAMMNCKTNDFFDPRGSRQTAEEVKKIYALLGKPENFSIHFEEGDHGYTPGNRMAMYQMFCHAAGLPAPAKELPTPVSTQFFSTENGRTIDVPGSRTLPQILAERAEKCSFEPLTKEKLENFLQLKAPEITPDYKTLRNGYFSRGIGSSGFSIDVFGIKTEPGILAYLHNMGLHMNTLCKPAKEITLLIADRDAETELTEMMKPDTFALDVRGSGKSFPLTSDRNSMREARYSGEFLYTSTGRMLNEPLFQGRVKDILSALKLLHDCGAETIHLIGRGQRSVETACAAALMPGFWKTLRLEQMPESAVREIVFGLSELPESTFPAGMLTCFDLPQLRDLLKTQGTLL